MHLYLTSLLTFVFISIGKLAFAQSTMEINSPSPVASTSIWDLVEQAGGIRYPIYAILIVGLLLIFGKVFELAQDKKLQKELEKASFADATLDDIITLVSSQSGHMLSAVMAKLLNVYSNNKASEMLHSEISSYNLLKQDEFSTFKQRIDFLSDTAGALGLLGTVWGMFLVFSSGSSDKETILIGMGVALMSTLLGLVVSIILNFFTTMTQGFFTKHLQAVSEKADELRFRLIELS